MIINILQMSEEIKHLDSVPLNFQLHSHFAVEYSEDNKISVVCKDGVYIFRLCGFMDNFLPNISFKKLFIKPTKFVTSAHLGTNINNFLDELPQFELYEAVLSQDITGELKFGNIVNQHPTVTKWSPSTIIGKGHSALAILSSTGLVEIFVRVVNDIYLEDYQSIANVTKQCIEHFSSTWKNADKLSAVNKLTELKKRANEVTPTAIAWSHLIKEPENIYCLLIMGHLGGAVTVWRFDEKKSNDTSESNLQFIGHYQCGVHKITSLCWQGSENAGILVVGDIEGTVQSIFVTDISLSGVQFSLSVALWTDEDKIKVDNINVISYSQMMFILIVKGSILLVYLLDYSARKFHDFFCFNAGNIQITGLAHFEENIVILVTYTGVVKEIKLLFEAKKKKLMLEYKQLRISSRWNNYRTHGLMVSRNKVYNGILMSPCKLKNVKREKLPCRLVIFKNNVKNALAIIMENPEQLLTNYWDCLELLRLNGACTRKLPWQDMSNNIVFDTFSNYSLKVYLWLAQSSEMLYDKVFRLEAYNLPASAHVRDIINVKTAMAHGKHLINLLNANGSLSDFQSQSLYLLNSYLKYLAANGTFIKLNLGLSAIKDIIDVLEVSKFITQLPAPACYWCRNTLIRYKCNVKHLDLRCKYSLMQIRGPPYFKCSLCRTCIHMEVQNDYALVLCPYCDIPLDLISALLQDPKVESDDTAISDQNDLNNCNYVDNSNEG